MLATMGWISEGKVVVKQILIRHQIFARSASRFSIFQKIGTNCHVMMSVGHVEFVRTYRSLHVYIWVVCPSSYNLVSTYLDLDHEDYACLLHWCFLLPQHMCNNRCCGCISAARWPSYRPCCQFYCPLAACKFFQPVSCIVRFCVLP